MADLVERVARAMCARGGNDPDAMHTSLPDGPFDEPAWRSWEPEARAALEAMKEQTSETERAVVRAVRPYHDISDSEWQSRMPRDLFRIAFRAMIDDALSDPSPPDRSESNGPTA